MSFAPDFSSIVVSEVVLPYRKAPYLKLAYSDPLLSGYEVMVIADSKNVEGPDENNRIVTFVVRFPRVILPEANTHRVISKNSASSRARSVKATVADVMNEPYVPLFTLNQKGMSGGFADEEIYNKAKESWLMSRDRAVEGMLNLLLGDVKNDYHVNDWSDLLDLYYDNVYNTDLPDERALNIHKQNANRIIEPFMWHEAIFSGTKWENFIRLRTDVNTAQPEIVALAKLVEKALEVSVPVKTWLHLPFADKVPVETDCFESLMPDLLLSATNCAQISYKDKSKAEKSTATTRLGEKLLALKHLSPFEHIAFDSGAYNRFIDESIPRDKAALVSNLGDNWVQLRHILAD